MPKLFSPVINKQLFILIFAILGLNAYAQIEFEKGYYVDNANQKIECQIRNVDWRKNPSKFEYRLTKNDKTQNATIKLVKEFGIDNVTKFVRKRVNIDRSSDEVMTLSNDINPIFKEEELFLKVLVQSKVTLYEYVDGNLRRYFYENENSDTEQLVFKRYKSSENKIQINNGFRRQLWDDLKCANVKISDLQSVNYNKKDLVNFFLQYIECSNNDPIYTEQKQKRDLFNLTLRPRLNSSSLVLKNIDKGRNFDFENETNFGFGIEAEFILPFNKNEWSILIESTYQSFKSKKHLKQIM